MKGQARAVILESITLAVGFDEGTAACGGLATKARRARFAEGFFLFEDTVDCGSTDNSLPLFW